jgi:Nucleotidyltransferase domain
VAPRRFVGFVAPWQSVVVRLPPERLAATAGSYAAVIISPPPPEPVAELAADLAKLRGVVAVVLGGSRAAGTHRPDSDWDIGLYYRASQRALDPEDVRRLGHPGDVSALGEWGPIVHVAPG